MAVPIRILVLEDWPDDAEMLVHELRSAGFDPAWRRIETEAEYLAHLDPALDVILADYSMPQLGALRALNLLKARGLDVPLIVVTGAISDEQVVECMKHGAADYLLKDRLARLGLAVRHALEERRLRAERRQSLIALRESEERYRDLVENANDIIYSHDLQGNYTSLNRAGERITGYTREEVLSMNFTQIVAPEYLETAREMMRRKMAGEKTTAYTVEIIAKDGRRIPVEVSTRLIFQNGVPVGVQGIARDITERRHLEEQLRQSQKMEAVGRLAGGIAHDFNNLLTAILGQCDLLQRSLQPDNPAYRKVQEIRKAGERAAALTRQLLAFSRKQMLQPKVLDLNVVVTDVDNLLRRLIGEHIELVMRLAPDLGRVKADPGQIEQVLMNLAVNARDAMPQGGTLTIETSNVLIDEGSQDGRAAVPAGHYVCLAVSDTGTGIPPAIQERIFEPFFTTKEVGQGTGLGLSTVFGIVKQSEGDITVESEVGRGTTFRIYLPQVDEAVQDTGAALDQAGAPSGVETVLLVEDDEVVRALTREILEMHGYRVLEARDVDEAVRLCEERQGTIDLLLTDMVMPRMSGRELAGRIRTLCPQTKVLFMSGYTSDAAVNQGALDDYTAFIQKPFTPDALACKIREVLDPSKQPFNNTGGE
jgi:PAS domain S-box-containing protein